MHILRNPEPPPTAPQWMHDAYYSITAAVAKQSGPGLPMELMMVSDPDYYSLQEKRELFLFVDSISQYWPEACAAHVSTVYERVFGRDVLNSFEKTGGQLAAERPSLPCLFTIPDERSELHPLPVILADETRIDGTALVVNEALRLMGLELGHMLGRFAERSGHQSSLKNMRGLQQQLIRDYSDERVDVGALKLGDLHIKMAVIEGIWRNLDIADNNVLDPGSLARFKDALKRSQADPEKNYKACHRLVNRVLDGFILRAGMEMAGLPSDGSLEEFGTWLAANDWVKNVDDVV